MKIRLMALLAAAGLAASWSGASAAEIDWSRPGLDFKEAPKVPDAKAGSPAALVLDPAQDAVQASVIDVDDDNFDREVAGSKLPVFVDLYATWCGPCKIAGPIVEELSKAYAGKVKFVRIDVDAAPALAKKLAVEAMPTFVCLKGGKETGRLVGIPSRVHDEVKAYLEDAIKKFLLK